MAVSALHGWIPRELADFEHGSASGGPAEHPSAASRGIRIAQSPDRVAHGAAVRVLVDVVRHALEAEVLVAAGQVGPGVLGDAAAELGRRRGVALEGREVGGDELRLLVAPLPADTG